MVVLNWRENCSVSRPGSSRNAAGNIRSLAVGARALLLVLWLTGCARHDGLESAAPPHLVVVHPQRIAMSLSIDLPGDLVGYYEAALHAKVTGYLKAISVDKGDQVRQGQVLAAIEVPELISNLERGKADLEIQRLTYERLKHVQESDRRLISQQDVDVAYAKYKQAEASVHTLETMVGYTKIIAPFDGIITGRFVDPGALVRAGGGDIGINETSALISPGATEGAGGHRAGGGPILTIAKIDRLRVYVYVPGKWCRYIRHGTPATLTFDEIPGLVVGSHVTRYAGALDLATRTMLTELDINNDTRALYPRMYAHVKLELVSNPEALAIPISALSEDDQKATALVANHGIISRRLVSIGLVQPNYVEVRSGLSSDDLVVDPFNPDLKDRQVITYAEPAPVVAKEFPRTDSSDSLR